MASSGGNMTKLLCYVPSRRAFDAFLATAIARMPADVEAVVVREPRSEDEWSEGLDGVDVVATWVTGTCVVGVADQLALRESAFHLVRAAKDKSLPVIAMGAYFDRQTVDDLAALQVDTCVSAQRFASFPEDLANAVRGLGGEIREVLPLMADSRVAVGVSLDEHSLRWFTMGSYHDQYVGEEAPTSWADNVLADLSQRAREGSQPEEYDTVGRHLGNYLLPDNRRAHRFYSGLLRVTNGSLDKLTFRVSTPDRWAGLPIELASLPQRKMCLSHEHPVVRVVKSVTPALQWHPPTEGLRVLLVASGVFGEVACPRGKQCCALESLAEADQEIRNLHSLFRDFCSAQNDTKATISVLDASNLTDASFSAALRERWDVFHYAGHGGWCVVDDQRSPCLFIPGPSGNWFTRSHAPHGVLAESWLNTLARSSPGALVFLSCCKGVSGGLVQAVASTKPCEAIGFVSSVRDLAARRLAEAFYSELLKLVGSGQCDVARAALLARQKVGESDDPYDRLAGRLAVVCIAGTPGDPKDE